MIDLHTHLLPGVDDGSPTMEHSAMVLERFAAEGVRGVACTPHIRASKAAEAPIEEYRALRNALQALVPSVRLYSGFEVLLDVDAPPPEMTALSLGTSNAILVEWNRGGVPATATSLLMQLRALGLSPLLAHVERYRGLTMDLVRQWREAGTMIQSDATALLLGGEMGETVKSLMSAGLVDVLASDNHGDRRTLLSARTWLDEVGAGEQATLLTEENPRRILAGEGLLPVAPVRFEHGMLDRLRALLRLGPLQRTTREEENA